MASSRRRVVVTGMGVLSPVGNDVNSTWENLINSVSGLGRVSLFDIDSGDYSSQIAGEVKDFDPTTVVEKKAVRRYDRFSLLAMAAAKEAWSDSGLAGGPYDPTRMGCILGVGVGGLETFEANCRALFEGGPRKVSPFLIPAMITNLGPGNIAIDLNLRGVNYTVTSACSSGTHAIGEAARMIAAGLQDVVVTGGSEAGVTPIGLSGFGRMKALSTRNEDPEAASRPFDRDRDGFVIAEGAAILVLEELEAAKKRGADILAEVVGYGFSCDAFHITAPADDGSGAAQCMRQTIEDAGINPEQVGYVNAHGTSTPINDPLETKAIKQVFGPYAKEGLRVSSTKSMTGHLLGAAGGLEAAIIVKALQTGVLPPTKNLENPDEGCDLDYVAEQAQEVPIEYAISNSFGFGGTNACVAMKRFS